MLPRNFKLKVFFVHQKLRGVSRLHQHSVYNYWTYSVYYVCLQIIKDMDASVLLLVSSACALHCTHVKATLSVWAGHAETDISVRSLETPRGYGLVWDLLSTTLLCVDSVSRLLKRRCSRLSRKVRVINFWNMCELVENWDEHRERLMWWRQVNNTASLDEWQLMWGGDGVKKKYKFTHCKCRQNDRKLPTPMQTPLRLFNLQLSVAFLYFTLCLSCFHNVSVVCVVLCKMELITKKTPDNCR